MLQCFSMNPKPNSKSSSKKHETKYKEEQSKRRNKVQRRKKNPILLCLMKNLCFQENLVEHEPRHEHCNKVSKIFKWKKNLNQNLAVARNTR